MPEDRARGYTVPTGGDPFNVPGDMARLADDVAADVGGLATRLTADETYTEPVSWPWGGQDYNWLATATTWADPPGAKQSVLLEANHLYAIESSFSAQGGVAGSPVRYPVLTVIRFSLWARALLATESEIVHQVDESEATLIGDMKPLRLFSQFRPTARGQYVIYTRVAVSGTGGVRILRNFESPRTRVLDLGLRRTTL